MAEIQKDIFWVGSIDEKLRNFHGYSTAYGSTYNAYLILDEKPTIIDTVKAYGCDDMIKRIQSHIDVRKIEYIISNHTEMDHSGSIEQLLTLCPHATVVCSPKGEEGLKRHFKKDWKFKVVQSGDSLPIGQRKLNFHLMPMVHWPDSMATYDETDHILFSNDAFGQHYASLERFFDEVERELILNEAKKYYGNIVLPYGKQVLRALEALTTLSIKTICPSHGLIWRGEEDIAQIVSLYQKWASHTTDEKVLIVYDTMWHSTEKMAKKLEEMISAKLKNTVIMNLQGSHISDVVTEIVDARVVLFGTPILNNRMLPTMASLLMYLKGLKPHNRSALTFGSYGWATGGFKEFESSIADAGFTLLQEGRYINYVPDENELDDLAEIADTVIEACEIKK